MDIFDALGKTSYNQQNKDFIFNFIFTHFADEKYNKIYLIKKKFQGDLQEEDIFLIEKIIEMIGMHNGSKFLKVSKILIYLTKDFPKDQPLIYLEKAHKHTIVPMQKDINKQTYQINVNSLKNCSELVIF